jgi:hypothetical protein
LGWREEHCDNKVNGKWDTDWSDGYASVDLQGVSWDAATSKLDRHVADTMNIYESQSEVGGCKGLATCHSLLLRVRHSWVIDWA